MADMVHGEEEGEGNEGEEEGEGNEGESNEGDREDYENGEELEDSKEREGSGIEKEVSESTEEAYGENKEDTEEEGVEETPDTTPKNTCRYCHQPGHKERKCPILHPELQKAPRMKPKKDVTELEIRDRVGKGRECEVDSTRTR